MKFQTKTIHAGIEPDSATGAVVTPIYQSNIYAFEGLDKNKGYEYSRMSNPTRKVLSQNLAALESGIYCEICTNGLAAETTLLHLFKKGDHIICGNDVYGGTIRLFNHFFQHFGLEVSYVSMIEPQNVLNEVRPNTKALWIETPSNPLLNIVDIEAMVDIARNKSLMTIVDNTLLTPVFQRPLESGVDIVLHSASKYLSGHNDVLGGVIITNDDSLAEQITFLGKALGTVAGPFDSWLILRGIKTLSPRMQEHEKNTHSIAKFLAKHDIVKKVYYPGLDNHPQKELIKKQMTGCGGVISFEIDGGFEKVNRILSNTCLFYLAQSFGGVESMIEHPKTMSHKSMSPEAMQKAGITDGLIRLSVGLEDVDDLIDDLRRALAA